MKRQMQWLSAASLLMLPWLAQAHGSFDVPVSRVLNCFKEGPESPKSAACRAAVEVGGAQALYDWNGINQLPNGNHKAFVPDGKLCSGGKELFKGMDLPRTDWVSTPISLSADGKFEFVYNASAPHATRYFEFYITRDGYDPTKPLKWSDLEATPFCTINSVKLENGRYRMNCPLPKNKSGKHVIYNIWQRSDSAEAFYACMDVEMNGQVVSDWREIGEVRAQQDLTVGSKVTLRVFDKDGRDAESHTVTLNTGMNTAAAWPYHLGLKVNGESRLVGIGKLDARGVLKPVVSATENRIYVHGKATYTTKIDIVAAPNPNPNPNPNPGPGCDGVQPWNSARAYTSGEKASFKGQLWQAQWWTRGEEPGSQQWGAWKAVGKCNGGTAPTPGIKCEQAWSASVSYTAAGIKVSHQGYNYRNKWWSRGDVPGQDDAWELLDTCK
ncbi:lytic polysaccharide monooxygenase [Chitinivorax sp. B]|uniref:lytic polysaccharide monooxygenase n=1 Tax=Chitinivorax sp. B TaxID=2502235 RepID=UPI0010F74AC8|nr:lytic polysaccharide monooxygenase [Chitinivorax sp. B]